MPATAKITDANPTVAEMEMCVARFRALRRGFKNVGSERAYLMGTASGHDPRNIDWPAQVRAAAMAVGVKLP